MLSRLSKKLIIIFAVLSVFVFTISFAVIDLQEDLVSYWSFDTEFPGSVDIAETPTSGTVTPDTAEANNENNALVQGATPTPGPANTAYYFDGSADLTVSDSDSLDLDSDLSLSFWMNPDAVEFYEGTQNLFVKDGAYELRTVENEVLNSSFEEDSPALDDWTATVSGNHTGTITRSEEESKFGEASAKINISDTSAAGISFIRQDISASEGEIWSVGVWINIIDFDINTVRLRIRWRDSGGNQLQVLTDSLTGVTSGWVQVTRTATSPSSTATLRIEIDTDSTTAGQSVVAFVDGFQAIKATSLENIELNLPGVTNTPFQSSLIEDQEGVTALYTVTRDGTTGDVIFCRGLFGAAIPVCDDAISGGTESLTTNTNDLVMGENFEGVLDEMRLWDRVLSLDEITFMQTIFPETVISEDLKSGADFIASLFLLPKDVFATGIIGIIGLVLYAATRTVHLMLGFVLIGVFVGVIYEYYDWWLLLIPVGLVTVFIILRITKIIKPREAE